jgi:hypothetical protein
MTWTAKTMPDDQVDPASLVGGMLQVEQQSDSAPSAGNAQPQIVGIPLCIKMFRAYWQHDETGQERMAHALDVVCDWLVPEAMEPSAYEDGDGIPSAKWIRWHERKRLRELLTEQARIARGEP